MSGFTRRGLAEALADAMWSGCTVEEFESATACDVGDAVDFLVSMGVPVEDSGPGSEVPLSFQELRETNRRRAAEWHGDANPWRTSDWSNAMMGEVGELAEALDDVLQALWLMNKLSARAGHVADTVKKLHRIDTGVVGSVDPGLDALKAKVADEIGDVACYLDLLADHLGIRLDVAIVEKFNKISDREGVPQKLRQIT